MGNTNSVTQTLSNDAEFVSATISNEYDKELAGKKVKILAKDFTSKGAEDSIQVKIDDDVIFVAKKFIIPDTDVLMPDTKIISKQDLDDKTKAGNELKNQTVVQNLGEEKTKISLDDLKDEIKNDSDNIALSKSPGSTTVLGDIKKDKDIIPNGSGKISIDDINNSPEDLQDKLATTLKDLNDIKKQMKNTFTSTDTVTSVITSIKGMIDAIRKDQLQMQENISNESVSLNPKENIKDFVKAQDTMIKMGEKVLTLDAPPSMIEEVKQRVDISKEWLKRADSILKSDNITDALKNETAKNYPNKTNIDKFTNKIWFDSLHFWLSLVTRMN